MKVILSCNEDPIYSQFWEPVSWAYKKMGFYCHLAYVTKKSETDPIVQHMREFGEVTLFKPIDDVPTGNQAKMARFILASTMELEDCYIDDIDLFPLRREFIQDKVDQFLQYEHTITTYHLLSRNSILLCVGGEVYHYNNCYPVSQMTAKGYTWKRFINPKDLSYDQLIRSWKDKAQFDDRENINIWPHDSAKREDYYFSDERLLKRLLHENPVPKLEIQRGYADYLESTIDRATFDRDRNVWEFDRQKLIDGGYVNAHCIRPYEQHKEHFAPLFAYINRHYGNN